MINKCFFGSKDSWFLVFFEDVALFLIHKERKVTSDIRTEISAIFLYIILKLVSLYDTRVKIFFLTFFNFLHTVLFRYPVVIKGEFEHRSRVPSAGDHILYSRDHNVWWKQCGEIQLSGVKGSRHFVCLNVPSNSAVSSVVPKSLYAVSYLPPWGRNKEGVRESFTTGATGKAVQC